MDKKKFIIDTDTASDDAVALIMAANHPDIHIEAVTIVAGNVQMEQAVQNAMYTLSLCKVQPPVFQGMAKPMLRALKTADHVHGKDGMGDIGLKLEGFVPEGQHAVELLIEKINAEPGQFTLVCMAPLTNIAMAILRDPGIAKKLKECIIMGGIGKGRGNVTPVSEYNLWSDPEAAKIVFESGMQIKMVGWDISRNYAVFEDSDVQEIRKIDTELAHFSVDTQKTLIEYANESSHLKGFDLPDPIAMAIAIDPSVAIEVQSALVEISTNDDYTRGQTIVDFLGNSQIRNEIEVVLKADREKFLQLLHASLA